jgi:5'-methylthioadenosine/S-adenosylhomocysteine nucleosidase
MDNWLILVAMEAERQALLGRLETEEVCVHPGLGLVVDVCGRHQRNRIVICRSSVGLVSAAISTIAVAERFALSGVFLLGVGGALREEYALGDTVIGETVVQHDALFMGEEGDELMAPGELFLSLSPEDRPKPGFTASPTLISWVRPVLSGAQLGGQIRIGTIASGSSFVARPSEKQRLVDRIPSAVLVEMEAAGVALACRRLNIPFLTIKTVVDRFRPHRTISEDYRQFLSTACKNAAVIAEELDRWAPKNGRDARR